MPLALLGVPVLRLPHPCIVCACAPWFLHGLPPFASVTLLSVDALTLRASRARLQLFALLRSCASTPGTLELFT